MNKVLLQVLSNSMAVLLYWNTYKGQSFFAFIIAASSSLSNCIRVYLLASRPDGFSITFGSS